MVFTPLKFGKHKNKTLPQVVFADLDYFVWSYNEGIYKNPIQKIEADYVYERIQKIKIPKENLDDFVVEYYIHQPTGKFGSFSILEKSIPLHNGGSPAFRLKVIDLTVVKTIKNYDKLGSGTMISCFK